MQPRTSGWAQYCCTGLFVVLAVTATSVVDAGAQEVPETGGRVFGLVGGSFGDGGSTVMTSGGAGLRLTKQLGIDFDVLYVSDLDLSTDRRLLIQPLPVVRGSGRLPFVESSNESALTAFATRLTVEFPTRGERLFPFVTGGGGVGHLTQRTRFAIASTNQLTPELLGRQIFPIPDRESSQTGLMLTFGGGLDVRLWKGLGVGVDVRYLRLLADRDNYDFAHAASRVSYRF